MKIGVVGALAAGLATGMGQIGAAVESINTASRNDLQVKAEEARRSGRTRSRIPGKARPAGSKLARKAAWGTLTLPRGRRGLLGKMGRVVA